MKHSKLLERLINFRDARDWKQFHTPQNLAKSLSIEAGELLECFQWTDKYDLEDVKSEVADLYTYLLLFANSLDIDLEKVASDKLAISEEKYPVEKAKGNATKYTKFKK
ncbi:MAG: nucleotide pyrophosphohydrolase [Candidatus Dojkabacteria bacterium]|nr:MAG: nucleotide pyrophosphohydrolase [Candidatus Dojkabacteria bacterium]